MRQVEKDNHKQLVEDCVANHDAAANVLMTPNSERYVIDDSVRVAPPVVELNSKGPHDVHLKHAAIIIRRLRGSAAPLPGLPTCKVAFSFTPDNVDPQATVVANVSLNVHDLFCVWQVVYRFKSQLWCVAAVRRDDDVVVFHKPRVARPLIKLLSVVHSLGADATFKCGKSDRFNTSGDINNGVLSQWCPCGNSGCKRRKRNDQVDQPPNREDIDEEEQEALDAALMLAEVDLLPDQCEDDEDDREVPEVFDQHEEAETRGIVANLPDSVCDQLPEMLANKDADCNAMPGEALVTAIRELAAMALDPASTLGLPQAHDQFASAWVANFTAICQSVLNMISSEPVSGQVSLLIVKQFVDGIELTSPRWFHWDRYDLPTSTLEGRYTRVDNLK